MTFDLFHSLPEGSALLKTQHPAHLLERYEGVHPGPGCPRWLLMAREAATTNEFNTNFWEIFLNVIYCNTGSHASSFSVIYVSLR